MDNCKKLALGKLILFSERHQITPYPSPYRCYIGTQRERCYICKVMQAVFWVFGLEEKKILHVQTHFPLPIYIDRLSINILSSRSITRHGPLRSPSSHLYQ